MIADQNIAGIPMREDPKTGLMPKIVVSKSDQERLIDLATAAMQRHPQAAEELLSEMDRAEIVDAAAIPPTVVRMGTTVSFESDDGQKRRVTLVFPGEADISQGRISILTPIGAALIGLSEGQSITWTTRDGRAQTLTILAVEPPAPDA